MLRLLVLDVEDVSTDNIINGGDRAETVRKCMKENYHSAISFDLACVEVSAAHFVPSCERLLTGQQQQPPSITLSLTTDMSCRLLHIPMSMSHSEKNTSVNLIEPFPLIFNFSKRDTEVVAAKFSVSLADVVSSYSQHSSSTALSLFHGYAGNYQTVMKMIEGFRACFDSDIPLLPSDSLLIALPNATAHATAHSTAIGTAIDIDVDVDIDKGGFEGQRALSGFTTAFISPSLNQVQVTNVISDTLLLTQKDLYELYRSTIVPSQSATAAIEEALLMCGELLEITSKLRQAALLTVGTAPTYCGWLTRSPGFSNSPPRVTGRSRYAGPGARESSNWGTRCWAVLVKGNLLFMAKPYSSTVDFSVTLDGIFVADPDEGEIAQVKRVHPIVLYKETLRFKVCTTLPLSLLTLILHFIVIIYEYSICHRLCGWWLTKAPSCWTAAMRSFFG